MKKLVLAVAVCLASAAVAGQEKLTYVDLVKRLTDLEHLAVLPAPGELCGQWSSYDRASAYDAATGKYVRWDANGDGDGFIAARTLGAEVEIVAWSGRKLWPDNTMVEVWDRIFPDKTEPKADMKGWVPDVVLVNLGTNDFGQMPNTPENEKGWIGAYKAFIKTIRGNFPNCYFIVAAGSMGIKPEWDKWAKEVVADQKAAGDTKIAYLPFENQKEEDGIGGDWHPSIKTHIKMADRLVKELQAAVGWTPGTATGATAAPGKAAGKAAGTEPPITPTKP